MSRWYLPADPDRGGGGVFGVEPLNARQNIDVEPGQLNPELAR